MFTPVNTGTTTLTLMGTRTSLLSSCQPFTGAIQPLGAGRAFPGLPILQSGI
jgi:hypothetical protein